jgi:hypothetical protein
MPQGKQIWRDCTVLKLDMTGRLVYCVCRFGSSALSDYTWKQNYYFSFLSSEDGHNCLRSSLWIHQCKKELYYYFLSSTLQFQFSVLQWQMPAQCITMTWLYANPPLSSSVSLKNGALSIFVCQQPFWQILSGKTWELTFSPNPQSRQKRNLNYKSISDNLKSQ